MKNRKKLIELFIYIIIVVIGVILLFTSNAQDKKADDLSFAGGAYHAAVFDE